MKNLGLFVALIVLNNASFGSPWLGYALWNPKEGTTDASFAVIFQGQNYLTPKAIVSPATESTEHHQNGCWGAN